MKFRLSVSNAVVLFGVITALGLAALIFASGYALQQLRVGGPLYSQIKLGNDLVADILPPPEYVLEAYLEATLALREPETIAERTKRLVQLRKDYDERREYWSKSDLDSGLKLVKVVRTSAEGTDRRASMRHPVDVAAVIQHSGRKLQARLLDISEGGAKISCQPRLELNTAGQIEIQGIALPIGFVVRATTQDTASLEVTAEGAARDQYHSWLSRRTGGQVAA
jgi:hypothetical protein